MSYGPWGHKGLDMIERLTHTHRLNKTDSNLLHSIMASGPIASWEIDGEIMETVRLYFFWRVGAVVGGSSKKSL